MTLSKLMRMVSCLVLAAGVGSVSSAPLIEVDVYKSRLGKFSCDAKEIESGKRFKATVETTVDFEGNTYIERYVETKSADHPNPWKAVFLMSYDPTSGKWVRNGVDNSGARNAASSSGWDENTWIWKNDSVNIVIDKTGVNSFSFAVDVKQSGGSVKRVAKAHCNRV